VNHNSHKSFQSLSVNIFLIDFALNEVVHLYNASFCLISHSKAFKRAEKDFSLSSIEILSKTSLELNKSIFFALKYLSLFINSSIL
jgi:hypothetical protein